MPKSDLSGASSPQKGEEYIEVWNDLVSPRDLTWSLVSCGGCVAIALGLATLLSSSLFMWGLGGAVLGFIISAVVFKPKRVVEIVEAQDLAAGQAAPAIQSDQEFAGSGTQGEAR